MRKWVKYLIMILIAACIWLLFQYFYYGSLEPLGLNLLLAIVFGIGMSIVDFCFFERKKK